MLLLPFLLYNSGPERCCDLPLDNSQSEQNWDQIQEFQSLVKVFVYCLIPSCLKDLHISNLVWEGLGAGGGGDDRGWDGWMASPTQWTWVWVRSGSWWWTGRPSVLRFMGLQRVGHDWATELNWTELNLGFPGGWDGKESTCNAGDPGLIPRSGRSLEKRMNGYPLQYSCLGNPMDRAA